MIASAEASSNQPVDARVLPVAQPVETIRPGVLRINSPLPFRGLKQVNLWLLEDGDGWTMIDCGFGSVDVQAKIEDAWSAALGGRPVTRLIVTHFHPDHMGNCGWIASRWGLRPWMSQPEWFAAQLAHRDLFTDDVQASAEFFAKQGLSRDIINVYREQFILYSRCVLMPDSYHELCAGQTLQIGDHRWRVLTAGGHSPALVGLYCDEIGLYIAGDQVLPKITPNISVVHWDPTGDPLGHYLKSLKAIRAATRDDVLVLPSHREPFHGLHGRLSELEGHHESRLETIRALLRTRSRLTAAECMNALFSFNLDGQQVFFAMGEALAHLNHLCARGEAQAKRDLSGVFYYQSC